MRKRKLNKRGVGTTTLFVAMWIVILALYAVMMFKFNYDRAEDTTFEEVFLAKDTALKIGMASAVPGNLEIKSVLPKGLTDLDVYLSEERVQVGKEWYEYGKDTSVKLGQTHAKGDIYITKEGKRMSVFSEKETAKKNIRICPEAQRAKLIILDMGHGGSDQGVFIKGTHEVTALRMLGLYLNQNLNYHFQTGKTREIDEQKAQQEKKKITKQERIQKIRNHIKDAGVLPHEVMIISLQIGEHKDQKDRIITYVPADAQHKKQNQAVACAIGNSIHKRYTNMIVPPSVPYTVTSNHEFAYEPDIPAVLIEVGNVKNPQSIIYTSEWQDLFAKTVSTAMVEVLK